MSLVEEVESWVVWLSSQVHRGTPPGGKGGKAHSQVAVRDHYLLSALEN